MSNRLALTYMDLAAEQTKKLLAFSAAVAGGAIEEPTRDLVSIRASQMNGCAFCLDMHIKQARLHGERELRLHHVAIWPESPLFTAREKAALAWTEALTALGAKGVSDAAYNYASAAFSEKELADLTFCIANINTWNRLGTAFQPAPGSADQRFGLDKANLT